MEVLSRIHSSPLVAGHRTLHIIMA
ncbi:hypothetical protein E2C01_074494 [Portunus trituberculatus]|uniref:Uncharacterized protein n=1 Tax=Portunus trituberculatus TaxID=210409 RepID=A0A5B7IDA9_PORTR|nr:hypothetical protein [Portunus trituberculatus]